MTRPLIILLALLLAACERRYPIYRKGEMLALAVNPTERVQVLYAPDYLNTVHYTVRLPSGKTVDVEEFELIRFRPAKP